MSPLKWSSVLPIDAITCFWFFCFIIIFTFAENMHYRFRPRITIFFTDKFIWITIATDFTFRSNSIKTKPIFIIQETKSNSLFLFVQTSSKSLWRLLKNLRINLYIFLMETNNCLAIQGHKWFNCCWKTSGCYLLYRLLIIQHLKQKYIRWSITSLARHSNNLKPDNLKFSISNFDI